MKHNKQGIILAILFILIALGGMTASTCVTSDPPKQTTMQIVVNPVWTKVKDTIFTWIYNQVSDITVGDIVGWINTGINLYRDYKTSAHSAVLGVSIPDIDWIVNNMQKLHPGYTLDVYHNIALVIYYDYNMSARR